MKTTNDKKFLVLSTFICLLPIIMFLITYNNLPEYMRMSWGTQAIILMLPKQLAIFVLPLILAAVHLLVIFLRRKDPKKENTSVALQYLIDWLTPVLSIFLNTLILLANTGSGLEDEVIFTLALAFVGLIFIIIGNYLPKNRQNNTIGIRLPWILNNTDIWNKTHRLAGKLFIIGGFLAIIGSALPIATNASLVLAIILPVTAFCVGIPIVYSLILRQKLSNR
jgi:uncharacterized membrane protein